MNTVLNWLYGALITLPFALVGGVVGGLLGCAVGHFAGNWLLGGLIGAGVCAVATGVFAVYVLTQVASPG